MCGLFGALSYGNNPIKNEIINCLAEESAARGTDATGISYNSRNKLHIYKRPKSAYQMNFKLPNDVQCVTGHTRHTTQGNSKYLNNNHPFLGKVYDGQFALAHNGILLNDGELKQSHQLPRTKIETDSYVAVQLIEKKQHLNMDTIKYMAETVTGSFSFSIMDDNNNMYLIKGDSPLSILHFRNIGLYLYASTEQILWKAIVESSLFQLLKKGEAEQIQIDDGDILRISKDGELTFGRFDYAVCDNGISWWNYGRINEFDYGSDYLSDLKSLSGYFGFTQDDIQSLHDEGFTADEIEEFLYESYGY